MNQELLSTLTACRESLADLARRVEADDGDRVSLDMAQRILRLLRATEDDGAGRQDGSGGNDWFADGNGEADVSNRRYSALIETLPVGIYRTAIDGTIIAVNPAEIAMFGFSSAAELKANNALDLYIDSNDREALLEQLRNEGSVTDYECRQRRKDGSLFWISTNVNAEFDERGNITYLNGIDIDITRRKEAKLALRASEERYRSFLENLPLGVFRASMDGRFISANPAMVAMYGYDSEEEILMAEPSAFYDSASDRETMLKRLLAEEAVTDYECRLKRKDGSIIWVSSNIRLGRDESGHPTHFDGIDLDITARKMAEEALRAGEERYRMLVETIPHGISENDIDGIITFSNPAHEKMLGFGPGESIGRPVCEAAATTDAARQDLMEHFRFLVETQPEPTSYVMRNRTASGESIDVQVDWNYKRDKEGRLVGFISVITDITDRLRAEEALRASEERARSQFQAMPVPTLTWEYTDADFALVDFNMAAREMTDGKIVDFLERSAREIFAPRPELLEDLLRCYRERIVIKRELEYTFVSTGQTRHLAAICSYGPPNLVILHIEDIGERKAAEARRQEATRERFEQAKHIAGAFAHEIRNALFPAAAALNKIKAAALDHGSDSDYYKKYAVIAERAVTNATGATRLISTYVKLDTEKNPERVVLSEVIDEVLANNKMRLGEDNITVTVSGDEHLRIVSNRKQLVLALNNIVINSLHALADISRPELSIAWERDGRAVHLVMSDNGGGIPAEILPNIFEPFFSTRSESGGTGIGLATTRKVIRMYGGDIAAISGAGGGARFAIELAADDTALR